MDVPGGSGPPQPGIDVGLAPSTRLIALIVVGHVTAAAPLALAGLPLPILVLIASLLLCHGAWAACRYGWLNDPRSAVALAIDATHGCCITLRNGETIAGTIGECVVTAQVVIVTVVTHPWRPPVRIPVASDMMSADQFRALRVALKWMPVQGRAASHS